MSVSADKKRPETVTDVMKRQQRAIVDKNKDDKDEVTDEPYSGSKSISLLGYSLLDRQIKSVK